MYSIVPQKVCVKQFSNTASLHKPKSVNTTCPVKINGPQGYEQLYNTHTTTNNLEQML